MIIRSQSIFVVSVLFVFLLASVVLAAHVITTSSGGTSFDIIEDVETTFNITVNNSDVALAANISAVNVTLPNSFTFTIGTNGTSSGAPTFVNTSTVLSWSADGLVMNLTLEHFFFNATAAIPGSYNFVVTTTNTSGSFSSNLSVTVNDTTVPATVAFASPSEGNGSTLSRDYILVNVTATDNGAISTILARLYNASGSQINSSSSSSSPLFVNFSGLSDGVYTFNATVNDTANNLNYSASRTVTIDTSTSSSDDSGGGSSGGSSGGGLPFGASNGISTVASGIHTTVWGGFSPGEQVTLRIDEAGFSVSALSFSVSEKVYSPVLKIKDISQPTNTPSAGELVAAYFEISKRGTLSDVGAKNAVISFRVPAAWSEGKSVTLHRYDELVGRWVPLSTRKNNEGSDEIIYDADTPDFSYFAIVGTEQSLQEPQEEAVAGSAPDTASEPELAPSQKDGSLLKGVGVVLILVIVALGVVATVYFMKANNRSRRKR